MKHYSIAIDGPAGAGKSTMAKRLAQALGYVDGTYVAMPFSGRLQAGKQYVEWNAYIPAGIYLATLTTTNGVETVKLLVK